MSLVEFTVYGTPVPQGSKSVMMRGGRPQMFDQAKGLDAWRKHVADVAEDEGHAGRNLAGPLNVRLAFHMPRPQAHYRTVQGAKVLRDDAPSWCETTPDIDKLARAVHDALTAAKVIADDRHIANAAQQKLYTAGSPGVTIRIDHITE